MERVGFLEAIEIATKEIKAWVQRINHSVPIINKTTGNWQIWDTQTEHSSMGLKGDKGDTGLQGPQGKDGFSPIVSISNVNNGKRVTIIDANGESSFVLMNGENGRDGTNGYDGVSPEVTVSEIDGGHTISVDDAYGTHTFNVMNGAVGPQGPIGATGAQGPQGEKGEAGGAQSWEDLGEAEEGINFIPEEYLPQNIARIKYGTSTLDTLSEGSLYVKYKDSNIVFAITEDRQTVEVSVPVRGAPIIFLSGSSDVVKTDGTLRGHNEYEPDFILTNNGIIDGYFATYESFRQLGPGGSCKVYECVDVNSNWQSTGTAILTCNSYTLTCERQTITPEILGVYIGLQNKPIQIY